MLFNLQKLGIKKYLLFIIAILLGLLLAHLYWFNTTYDLQKGNLVNIEIDEREMITTEKESTLLIHLPYKDTYMLSFIFPSLRSGHRGFEVFVNGVLIASVSKEGKREPFDKRGLKRLVDRYILGRFQDIPSEYQCIKLVIPIELVHQGPNVFKFSYQRKEDILPFDQMILRNYRASVNSRILFFRSNKYILEKGKMDPFGLPSPLYYFISLSLFLVLWMVYSYIFSWITKVNLSKALYLDLSTYAPPLLLLGGFGSLPLVSSFYILTSFSDLFLTTLMASGIVKFYLLLRYLYVRDKTMLIYLKDITFEYCHKNMAGALIIGFILFLFLCAFLLVTGLRAIAEPIANLAYLLLVVGIVLRLIEYARKRN